MMCLEGLSEERAQRWYRDQECSGKWVCLADGVGRGRIAVRVSRRGIKRAGDQATRTTRGDEEYGGSAGINQSP